MYQVYSYNLNEIFTELQLEITFTWKKLHREDSIE